MLLYLSFRPFVPPLLADINGKGDLWHPRISNLLNLLCHTKFDAEIDINE